MTSSVCKIIAGGLSPKYAGGWAGKRQLSGMDKSPDLRLPLRKAVVDSRVIMAGRCVTAFERVYAKRAIR